MGPNWYDVLDVDATASGEEIRDAWRAAIADLTPADRRFRLYNQAAEVLLDPERRAAHDAELAEQAEQAAAQTGPQAGPAPAASEEAAPAEADASPEPAAVTPQKHQQQERPVTGVRPSTGWVVPVWLLAVVGVLAALAVAAMSYLWTQPSEGAVAEAATGARNAAERAAVTVLSYDYETLEDDQAAAHEVMTSDYRKKYDELFAVIEENGPSTQTEVDVDVVASSLVRSGEDRVEVLLFVDRPTTNKVTRQPVVYKDQATLTMERVGDQWLVDDVRTSPVQP